MSQKNHVLSNWLADSNNDYCKSASLGTTEGKGILVVAQRRARKTRPGSHVHERVFTRDALASFLFWHSRLKGLTGIARELIAVVLIPTLAVPTSARFPGLSPR